MFRNSVMEQQDIDHIYSSNIENGEWIQPSISIEIIEPSGKPKIGEVYSIYLIDKRSNIIDCDLLEEIQEWELASDFDFRSFEETIRD